MMTCRFPLALLIFVFVFIFVVPSWAQVVIRERVGVSPSNGSNLPHVASTAPVYVASDSGILSGRLYLARKHTPLQPGVLRITLHDTTLTLNSWDYVSTFQSYQAAEVDPCHDYVLLPYTVYQAFSPFPDYLRFFLYNVHRGDTIALAYNNGSSEISVTQVSGGEVIMAIPDEPCYTYFEGSLHELERYSVQFDLAESGAASYRLTAAKDTIKQQQTTPLRLTAMGLNGVEAPIDSATLFTLRLAPDSLGQFVGPWPGPRSSPVRDVRYADLRAGRISFLGAGSWPDSSVRVRVQAILQADTTKFSEDSVLVVPFEILLGETKYYRARYNQQLRLTIEELDLPQLGGLNNVWETSPVQVVHGEHLAVYWGRRDANDKLLDNSIIRLVGRYWEEGRKCSAKLAARHGGDSASIIIVVQKPRALGTTFAHGIDTSSTIFSIDSLCILYGGKFGIPPQFLKAQIRKEAKAVDSIFHPTYVYEPYTTQFSPGSERPSNPFYVRWSSMGSPPVPPGHRNVRDYYYFLQASTVWDVVKTYSQIEIYPSPGSIHKYGCRRFRDDYGTNRTSADAPLYFYGIYREPQRLYDGILDSLTKRNNDLKHPCSQSAINEGARQLFVTLLRDRWKDKPLDSIYAQTRIAASYGFFQVLYTTAVGKSVYPEASANLPETINGVDLSFSVSCQLMCKFLEAALGEPVYTRGYDWPHAPEKTYALSVWKKWNKASDYPVIVQSFADECLPIR